MNPRAARAVPRCSRPPAAACRTLLAAAALLLGAPLPTLRADQLETAAQRRPRGKVIGIEQGELRFRCEDSTIVAVPLAEVGRLYIEPIGEFTDFNAAEQLVAEGEPAKAIARYERQLRTSEAFWIDLIRVRLLRACDLAGQLDKSVLYYLKVLEDGFTGPPVAARVMPERLPEKVIPAVNQAVDQLARAIGRDQPQERRALLMLLRYDILRRAGDPGAAAMAPVIAELSVPPGIVSPRTSQIQLEALRAAMKAQPADQNFRLLDRGIRGGDDAIVPDLLLLKARLQLESAVGREDVIRAGWTFMRVVAHYPNDRRAAEALLGAAEVHARLNRPDQARVLLEECLRHKAATESVQVEARRRLEALTG